MRLHFVGLRGGVKLLIMQTCFYLCVMKQQNEKPIQYCPVSVFLILYVWWAPF